MLRTGNENTFLLQVILSQRAAGTFTTESALRNQRVVCETMISSSRAKAIPTAIAKPANAVEKTVIGYESSTKLRAHWSPITCKPGTETTMYKMLRMASGESVRKR